MPRLLLMIFFFLYGATFLPLPFFVILLFLRLSGMLNMSEDHSGTWLEM